MKVLARIRKKWQIFSKVQEVTVLSNQFLAPDDIKYIKDVVKDGIDSNVNHLIICVKLACSLELISPTLIRINELNKGEYEVSILKI